jgi:diguanylate cyclase
MDLDHFKEINDTLGHKAGDELLVQVAARLTACVDARGLTARLGGDEFAVLLPRLPTPAAADRVARQVLAALAAPLQVEGVPLSVEASVGVATAPADGVTISELLKNADIALYKAKEVRGSFRHFNSDTDDADRTRLTLSAELREAIETHQLELYYQPQRRLTDGRLVGVEGLARWHHPERGLLMPDDFIGVAESSGLIRAFTRWVLEQAAGRAAAWRAAGYTLAVGVNLSARNLQDAALPADVSAVLARHRLPPDALVLEVTETTVVGELDVVEDVLASLRLLGVPLSLDDFGTGYSSLGVLRRLALHELKIDRSLVERVLDGGDDAAIVRATVELAHALGLRVVAEGVADAATQAAMAALGCDVAQGWHLGLPMAAAGIDALLAAERRPVVPAQPAAPRVPRRRPRPVA